jgi:hypothetical protein
MKATAMSYSVLAMPILKRLTQRPVATSPTDIGVDGEWNEKPIGKPADLVESRDLEPLCLSVDDMVAFGYSIKSETAGEVLDSSLSEELVCDRCQQTFSTESLDSIEPPSVSQYLT